MTALLFVAAGCALLMLRPLLSPGGSTLAIVLIFAALLLLGASARILPSPGRKDPRRTGWVWVLAIGVGAFAAGRLVAGGHGAAPFTARVVALNTLAAVAEEAFFRRFVFGALQQAGASAGYAIAGSAVLFSAVHLTIYGAWVLPLDLAAGVILGWQRWASGRWSIPAATHVVANVLVVI